jgi:uncharacterized protein YbjT (DUF2867 family)
MRLFITGASGYIGKYLLAGLIEAGHKPVCLVRPGSVKYLEPFAADVEIIKGHIRDSILWKSELHGIDGFINLIGIIREFPARRITFQRLNFQATADLVELATEIGVKRFLQMSALGASPASQANYHRTKYEAEMYVRTSILDWTIFRPSLIIGKGNIALKTMVSLIKTAPFIPVIGNGEYRMQPVDIDNVVEGFVKALSNDNTIGKLYDIGGPDRISYNRLIDIMIKQMGFKTGKISISVTLMKLIADIFGQISFFPFTRGQINMLLEESITNSKVYFDDLHIEPIALQDSLRKVLNG